MNIDIEYDFDGLPMRGSYLSYCTHQTGDDTHEREFKFTDFEVSSSPGAPTILNTESRDGVLTIRIGDLEQMVLTCRSVREAFHLITNPQPAETGEDLRPCRHLLGLALATVAGALNGSLGKISRAERGIICDRNFIRDYRRWLIDQQQT